MAFLYIVNGRMTISQELFKFANNGREIN